MRIFIPRLGRKKSLFFQTSKNRELWFSKNQRSEKIAILAIFADQSTIFSTMVRTS
jgi:hypothetical protein